jgi:hypothetical protein
VVGKRVLDGFFGSSPNPNGGEGSPRMGHFLFVDSHHVEVYRWDKTLEDMLPEGGIAVDERERLIDGVIKLRFDDRLGV